MRTRWQAPFGTAALLALAWAGATTAQPEPPDAAADFEQSGLALALRLPGSAATDARVARLLALYVPEGQNASPFLDAGPFEATFRGAIELDLNDSYRFNARGSGSVRLSIGGEVVIERQELPAGDAALSTDGEVRLSKGLTPIELVYRSPSAGDASLRVTWGNDYLPEEPLPPASLRHADTPALELGRARRAGRDLASLSRVSPIEYAERQIRRSGCLACHSRDGAPASRPDHAAPDLTWAGEKLRSDWIEDYLARRLAARPRPHLQGRASAFAGNAGLFAAGLHHQHGLAASPPDTDPIDEELAAIGRDLIRGERLGCHACHGLGDEAALGGEGSAEAINFRLVRQRLRRPYFDWFLRDPQRILPGTKMPQFVDEDGYTALYDVFDGEATRQFEAIWHYLGTLD